jgi:hypothetical protein
MVRRKWDSPADVVRVPFNRDACSRPSEAMAAAGAERDGAGGGLGLEPGALPDDHHVGQGPVVGRGVRPVAGEAELVDERPGLADAGAPPVFEDEVVVAGGAMADGVDDLRHG